MRTKLILIIAVIAIIGGLAYYFTGSTQEAQGIGVVTRGDLVQRVTIAGNINPNRRSVISAPYNGYVRKIFVEVGQKVKEGDPVVLISQSLRGASEESFPLRAPFSGTVVQVLKSVGEYVDTQSGQGTNSLVRIDDLSRLFIEGTAPEIEVGKLAPGQDSLIRVSAILDRTYSGKIEHVALASKTQSQWESSRVEFPATISIDDADEVLKPGMSVIADVTTDKKENVLMLAHEYIRKDKDEYFVIMENGERRKIELGLQNDEAFEILGGLKEGDRVKINDFMIESGS